MINRTFFFDQCRQTLFAGHLRQGQVDGLTRLLDTWEQDDPTQDDRWLAYALGTTFHETAFAMQPIKEFGNAAYFLRMYDPQSPVPARAALARRMGAQAGDGPVYFGRGFVQLTWRRNYAEMGRRLDIDLEADPDQALQAGPAARILFEGMGDGIFTGKKFSDYFDGAREDWINARRIINGLDCAENIAMYARKFYAAISYTTG